MNEEITKKILLIMLAGIGVGFTYNRYHRRRFYRYIEKEWRKIDREKLAKEVRNMYRSKLVTEKKNPDGSFTFVLSDKGKLKALTYHFAGMKIENKTWDKKWRAVFFDIPEKYRWGRDSLRDKLKKLGFYELQKSVFVFPYPCEDEIEFIIEFYGIRKYARHAVLESIDSDEPLKKHFSL